MKYPAFLHFSTLFRWKRGEKPGIVEMPTLTMLIYRFYRVILMLLIPFQPHDIRKDEKGADICMKMHHF